MKVQRCSSSMVVVLWVLLLVSVAAVSAAQEAQPGQVSPQKLLDTTGKAKIALYGEWGIGLEKVDVGKTSDGDTVSISGGGGLGFGLGMGYGIVRKLDLDIDLLYQISPLTPPVDNADGTFKRTMLLATLKYKIPTSEKGQFKIGAGIGQYFGGKLDVDTTNVLFGSHVIIDYKSATGYHVTGEYEHMIRESLSVHVGAKVYFVTYQADSATVNGVAFPVSGFKDEVRDFNGNGFDFLVGISQYF